MCHCGEVKGRLIRGPYRTSLEEGWPEGTGLAAEQTDRQAPKLRPNANPALVDDRYGRTVINSLALGFRLLAMRFELLVLPVALSITVFVLPPVDLSASLADMDLLLEQVQTQTETLNEAGLVSDPQAASRLAAIMEEMDFSRLYVGDLLPIVGRTFFRIPTYISTAVVQELSPSPAWSITSLAEMLALMAFLVTVGAVVGAFYLYWLAQFVPNFSKEDGTDTVMMDDGREFTMGRPPVTMSRCIGQGLLYVGVLIALWFGTAFFVSLLLTLLSLVAGLGVLLSSLIPFLMTVLAVALILFLFYQTYATAGIMMDGLSMWKSLKQSVQLVRQNVLSTLAFLVLGGFILLGVQQMLDLLVTALQDHWVGILVATVIFAYVGTVISLAFLVFYRTRYLKNHGYDIAEYFALQDS